MRYDKYILILVAVFGCVADEGEEAVPLPLAPTNLSAQLISGTQVALSWTDNATNETGFKIERKQTGGQYSNVGTVNTDITVYSDNNLTVGETYTYRVYSFNKSGNSATYSNEVTIKTESTAILTTTNVTSITATSAISGGDITSDGGASITARGVCWSTSENPTISNSKTINGTGIGSFTSSLSGLSPGTTYYVRAYATNSVGTGYGNAVSFTTQPIELPALTTIELTSVTMVSAVGGGNITNDGGASITARGVCWSTSENPTISNSKTSNGTGTGSFTSSLSGLSPSTTYFVRAYATNSAGTAYGNELSFTTTSVTYPPGSVFCNGIPTAVVDVTNPTTGKIWMDRNLGASQVATSSTDANSYGDLYQWGRRADGHQCRNSATTNTLSSTDQPSHGSFILSTSSPYDWRSPQNNNLWQGVNGVNNPCPSGYRLPTATELEAEHLSWSSVNATGAFASPLKLPEAGERWHSDGAILYVGMVGFYWSSTVSSVTSLYLHFDYAPARMYTQVRAFGFSVRCIKD
jgi:uncharacterized protein (TIGR02145 family)